VLPLPSLLDTSFAILCIIRKFDLAQACSFFACPHVRGFDALLPVDGVAIVQLLCDSGNFASPLIFLIFYGTLLLCLQSIFGLTKI
jgi:hypothetical protein